MAIFRQAGGNGVLRMGRGREEPRSRLIAVVVPTNPEGGIAVECASKYAENAIVSALTGTTFSVTVRA